MLKTAMMYQLFARPVVGHAGAQIRTGAGFAVESMGGHISASLPDGLPDQVDSTDDQWLCDIARRQVAHVKATAIAPPIGGTLQLASTSFRN